MEEKVTNALLESCQTGRIGDGKIFVTPISQALRIRTGESGDAAVSGAA
jgi:nitrogen regulatory protein P-II 1